MCSILLVEDHKLMADALVRVLHNKSNYKVTDIAASAEEALEHLAKGHVDLALVDVVLPDTSGINLVSQIREKYPGLPCLMISSWKADQYVTSSLVAGARGYVLKDDVYEVIDGIQRVLEGGTYLSKQLSEEE